LVVLSVVLAIARGPRTAPDPWGGDTLEWAAATPPRPYNFATIPPVFGLHPVWDQRTMCQIGGGEVLPGHQTILTSELDARPQRLVSMPEASLRPLLAALALLLVVLGLLWAVYWLAIAGVIATIVVVVGWLWPAQLTGAEA